jgi:hypothetical protein
MTEAEWVACADPERMLAFLVPRERGRPARVSDRKVRLFEVACCRRIWPLITGGPWREAVVLAERYADGEVGDRGRRAAASKARPTQMLMGLPTLNAGVAALRTTEKTCGKTYFLGNASAAVAYAANRSDRPFAQGVRYRAARSTEMNAQVGLARCVFGNPFRPVTMAPAWRTPDVIGLAQAAYENRILPSGGLDQQHLTILADALEDAGCSDRALLDHLRGPGVHVRGCWAVDALLGKT